MQLRGSRWDETEIRSICPMVSQIWAPCRSVHLQYPCMSVNPPLIINDILGYLYRASLEMHFEAVIERVWTCTWRPRSSELSDALGGRDTPSWEMNFEVVMERVWGCSFRPWSSDFGDALWSWDPSSSEICTWGAWSCELEGREPGCLEILLEAMIDQDWGSTWK